MRVAKIMWSESFKIVKIAVGVWGTEWAMLLANVCSSLQFWSHEEELSQDILTIHLNSSFLADIPLPETLGASINFGEVVQNSRILVASEH